MGRPSMSRIEYGYGWSDPRGLLYGPSVGIYRYEVVYKFRPMGYAVVKRSLVHQDVVEVLVNGLTKEAAEGFIKLLKEN
jgi:hypothetical protein